MIQPTERLMQCGRAAGALSRGAAHAALWLFAGGLLGLAGTALGQPADLPLSNTNITSGSASYVATHSITAGPAFTVSGSAAVSFTAGSYIVLGDGFRATAGSAGLTFQASIGQPPPPGGTTYSISVVQGTATVAPGGTANYLLAVQPAGYPGQIGALSMSIVCDAVPSQGGYPWVSQPVLTQNTDGTISVLVAVAQTIASQCPGTQYDLTIPVYGGSQAAPPYIPVTNVGLTLNVLSTPTLSMGAQLLSQTALTATFLVTGAANFQDTVSVGLQAGSCAYLIGHPAMTVNGATGQTGRATVRVSVGTLGCAPGAAANLTFTGTRAGASTAAATAAAQVTPLTQTAMLTPPPGTLIPPGTAAFTWRPGPGVAQTMLKVGSAQGGGDYYSGVAGTGTSATVTVPAGASAAYATLSSWTGSAWVAQSYSYAVSSQPGTQALQWNGTPAAARVPANGREVLYTYSLSSGDARTISGVRIGGVGATARVASATAGTVVVAYQAAPGTAVGTGTVYLDSPGGTVSAAMGTVADGSYFDFTVSPMETTAGNLMTANTEGFGFLEYGLDDVTVALCDGSYDGCQVVAQTGLRGQNGLVTFTTMVPGTYCVAMSTADNWEMGSDAESAPPFCSVTFLPVGTPVPPTPAVNSVTFDTPPVPGLTGDGMTITGSNFAPAGLLGVSVQVCDSSSGSCTDATQPSWDPTGMTIHVWWDVPAVVAGALYCVQVTTHFSGGGMLRSLCGAVFLVPPPGVTVAMRLESLGTVINPASMYSEDTTIRVTAVNADTRAPITTFVGAVKIAEDGTQIYLQNGGCLVFVQNGCSPSSSVVIAVGGTATFVARSLAGPKAVHVLHGPPGLPPDPALIKTTNYPVAGGTSLSVDQWIVTNPNGGNIDPSSTGPVYDWFQTWTRDIFQAAHSANGTLNTVLSAIKSYSVDASMDAAGRTEPAQWGLPQSPVKFNPLAGPFRTNGDGGEFCMQPRIGFLVNALYHEGRHAYQVSLATLANDEDQDGLVNVIPIAPVAIFQDSAAPRAVCDPSNPDLVQMNWMFLGPGRFDAFDAPAANQQGPGHVRWAMEMDALAFAADQPQ